MNLHKKCLRCGEFFPAKPLEFKFFCDKKECQNYFTEYHFYSLKSSRHLPTRYFDIYDLDRPIPGRENLSKDLKYERVCRECGKPLLNKDDKYSVYRRYCHEHTGAGIWAKYNWGMASKNYAYMVQDENKEFILENIKDPKDLRHFVVCEQCLKICLMFEYWKYKEYEIINVHHKIPVHTLNIENFGLIWDYGNLICLCKECHNKQDHQLKKLVPVSNKKYITLDYFFKKVKN